MSHTNRLGSGFGNLFYCFSTVLYVVFLSVVKISWDNNYWENESLDLYTMLLIASPFLWLIYCSWGLVFDFCLSFGEKSFFLLRNVLLLAFAILSSMFHLLDHTFILDPNGVSIDLALYLPFLVYFLFIYYVFSFDDLRRGPDPLLLSASIQILFLCHAILSIETVFSRLACGAFVLLTLFLRDYSGNVSFPVLYLLQTLVSLFLVIMICCLVFFLPLALRLKKAGYCRIPIYALWLLHKRSRISELNVIPASEVGYDLMECVRLNYGDLQSKKDEVV